MKQQPRSRCRGDSGLDFCHYDSGIIHADVALVFDGLGCGYPRTRRHSRAAYPRRVNIEMARGLPVGVWDELRSGDGHFCFATTGTLSAQGALCAPVLGARSGLRLQTGDEGWRPTPLSGRVSSAC